MPVPKRKTSKARRNQRSSSWGLQAQSFGLCPNESCKAPKLPHIVCSACGFYGGKKVVATKVDRAVKRSAGATKTQQVKAQAEPAEESKQSK